MKSVLPLLLFIAFAAPSLAQHSGHLAPTYTPCMLSNGDSVEHCVLHDGSGNLFISPEVLEQLEFDANGLSPIRVKRNEPFPWAFANRAGRVVVSGVPTFDNGADDFSEGLVRTAVNNKIGFADVHGRLIIPADYDWAGPFKNGHAEACHGCREQCAMPGGTVPIDSTPHGCDHHIWVGGEWFKIDHNGNIVERLAR